MEPLDGVFCTEADLCQFGLSVVSGELSKKPTRFMSNDPYVLGELHRRCQNDHRHQRLESDLPLKAQKHPPLLVKAIVDGLMESMSDHIDGRSETFALIPNQEPEAQEDESEDEEESEVKECRRVRYPAHPSPNVRVDLPKHLQEQVKRLHVITLILPSQTSSECSEWLGQRNRSLTGSEKNYLVKSVRLRESCHGGEKQPCHGHIASIEWWQ